MWSFFMLDQLRVFTIVCLFHYNNLWVTIILYYQFKIWSAVFFYIIWSSFSEPISFSQLSSFNLRSAAFLSSFGSLAILLATWGTWISRFLISIFGFCCSIGCFVGSIFTPTLYKDNHIVLFSWWILLNLTL